MTRIPQLILLLFLLSACTPSGAKRYRFPEPVDTSTRPIKVQAKKKYAFAAAGLTFDNLFAGARLNNVEQVNDTLFTITIEPENEPINPSPWYAFRVAADRDRSVSLRLTYPDDYFHRYFPKVSLNRKDWVTMDSAAVWVSEDKKSAILQLSLKQGQESFIAGQEVINTLDVADWLDSLATKYPAVLSRFSAGKSMLERDLPAFSLRKGAADDRPTIVLMSRQHPPEITGFICFQAFLAGLLEHPQRDAFLAKYQVLVYPLLNPDGVDMGHWRHGAGGIDGNRDWAKYRQPEARQVANDIVRRTKETKSRVVLGIDFHSTWKEVFY
ncbi:MAG: M14 family zinc carboxypeptidase, partial [Bacteroidota bacterium]